MENATEYNHLTDFVWYKCVDHFYIRSPAWTFDFQLYICFHNKTHQNLNLHIHLHNRPIDALSICAIVVPSFSVSHSWNLLRPIL